MARAVITTEIAALSALTDRIGDEFIAACDHLMNCDGRIVVLGMGKSGHIGGKIAATPGKHRQPRFLCPPWRSEPWRPGHDHAG